MYWEYVDNLNKKDDKYWFVNEFEVRISTGIALVLALLSLFLVLFKAEYMIPLIIIFILWIDFVLKVFLDPKYSIFWSIIRPFIKNIEKVYVWAIQKRFAWSIWLIISSLVLLCLILQSWVLIDMGFTNNTLLEIQKHTIERQNLNWLFITPLSPPILLCFICVVFMWFESIVGYCVWCNIYSYLSKKWIIKKYSIQNCLNWKCNI